MHVELQFTHDIMGRKQTYKDFHRQKYGQDIIRLDFTRLLHVQREQIEQYFKCEQTYGLKQGFEYASTYWYCQYNPPGRTYDENTLMQIRHLNSSLWKTFGSRHLLFEIVMT